MAGANWLLKVLREGIEPTNEANTSRYVHEVLTRCLRWPFENILPQASKRGFIDYRLEYPAPPTQIHVEVKRFGASLRSDQIRDYIVRPGPGQSFRIGVLTNLQTWHVYAAGPWIHDVSGRRMIMVDEIEIASQADIGHLDDLVGYRANGHVKEFKAQLGEADDILWHLLKNDGAVLKAIRRVLGDIRDRHGLEARVPQYDRLSNLVVAVVDGAWSERHDSQSPFTYAKLRQAIGHPEVAATIDELLVDQFGSRSRRVRIQSRIRDMIRESEEWDDE